jgi:hypothetical protein
MSTTRKLRHDRAEWVRQRRAQYEAELKRGYDDGMSHGIIPFGAARMWEFDSALDLKRALSAPLQPRLIQTDETGVLLAVTCPYCRHEHQHLLDADGWDGREVVAGCGRGNYEIGVSGGDTTSNVL